MLNFRRKNTEEETIKDNDGDLVCEEAIMRDKNRFGRVRKSMMIYLRSKYGEDTANRALWRVNRRHSKGYFENENQN